MKLYDVIQRDNELVQINPEHITMIGTVTQPAPHPEGKKGKKKVDPPITAISLLTGQHIATYKPQDKIAEELRNL